MSGTLYIVATPIGNLEDITLRALRLLRESDVIAAEDTRHTRKLLSHFEISTPLIAYHQHSDTSRVENLLVRLAEGQSVALVTDAGTPGVSDPGVELVQAALAAGITVVPIPGASAVLCALVASGLPPARFAFEGFLPRHKSTRLEKLQALAAETRTLIFYEAPPRTADTLREMATAFGPTRRVAVGRELTKKYEEFVRGSLEEVSAHFTAHAPRGEITIVVAGDAPPDVTLPELRAGLNKEELTLDEALAAALAEGLTERDAVRRVASELHLNRREVYTAMLAMKE
jgi:16S rRNA (cytidine1402-2'-O)-methyltransferase